jgi:hypothetical protein
MSTDFFALVSVSLARMRILGVLVGTAFKVNIVTLYNGLS